MCRCVRRRRPLCLSPRRVGGSAAGGGGARVAAGYVSAPGAHRSSGTSLTRSYNAGERAHRTTSGRRARGSTTNARARRARSISRRRGRAQRASGSGHGPARTARTAARVYVRSPAAAQTGGGVLLPRARCVVLRGALCKCPGNAPRGANCETVATVRSSVFHRPKLSFSRGTNKLHKGGGLPCVLACLPLCFMGTSLVSLILCFFFVACLLAFASAYGGTRVGRDANKSRDTP